MRSGILIGSVYLLASFCALAQEDILRPRGAPVFPLEERRLPITLGIEGGLNWNTASQELLYSPFQPSNTPNQQFKSGSGFSPLFNLAADLGFTPTLGLQLRAGYDIKTWGHSGTAEVDCQDIYDPTRVTVIPLSVDWTFTVHYITLGAGLRYSLTPTIWLIGGFTVHLHQSNQQKATFSITDPNTNCGFINPEDGQRYRTLEVTAEFNAPPMKKTRVGIELGAGYKVPIGRTLFLVPRLQFQWLSSFREDLIGKDAWKPYTEGVADVQWRNASQYSLQLLVGLWFGL